MGDRPALSADALHAWSSAWGLSHDRERAAQLVEAVNGQIADLAALWDIDVRRYDLMPTPPAWRKQDAR